MVKTTLVEAVSPRRLRNTSYHRAPGSADRLAENQLVAPRAARPYSIADLAVAIEKTIDAHDVPFAYWQRNENTAINGLGLSLSLCR